MIYGVKIQNYLKGWYEIALFATRKQAESCFEQLNKLWNYNDEHPYDDHEMEYLYEKAFENEIGHESEFGYKDEVMQNVVNKDFPYTINEDGHIKTAYSNMTFVNNGDYTYIPA